MPGTAPNYEARLVALRALAKRFDIDPEDWSTTAGEDLAEMLQCPPERWVTVTAGGEYVYLKGAPSLDAAKAQATAHTLDDYSEAPGLIVDLDSGETYAPRWSSLEWARES